MSPPVHPQARFDPFPPDLDLPELVENAPPFRWAQRITLQQIDTLGQERFEKLVLSHVIQGGKPLVIEGWKDVLPTGVFTANWLEHNYGDKRMNVHMFASAPKLTSFR